MTLVFFKDPFLFQTEGCWLSSSQRIMRTITLSPSNTRWAGVQHFVSLPIPPVVF